MAEPTLIGPVPASTPSERKGRRASRHDLPPDLLREASRRLAVTSLVGGLLWLLGSIINHLIGRPLAHKHQHGAVDYVAIPDVIAALIVLVSMGLFVYARRSQHKPRFILDLGLGYMILISLAMGQMFHWAPLPPGGATPMISWIGPLMIMFAAIMPTTPGKTFVAGMFAASMNPLGMLIAKARGNWDFGPNINVLVMHYPDYLLVGVAVAISHIFTRLGEQVTRARELGSYRLGELLGGGGMGEVYRATHRMLARPAAIKLIRREIMADGSDDRAQLIVQRFRHEAHVAASLRSPHTVALYDFGVTDDGTLYLVMELLDGMDLEALVRAHGPLPASRVVHILMQVCASLEEAHARRLVHRDIKPANIHVGRLGLKLDFVKVLDFGLVKATDVANTGELLRTAEGQVLGTPAYMAPELALGRDCDGRTDLYALGCVAYFALTGREVFEADSVLHVLAMHLHDTPAPPSQHAALPVPAALDALVLACLAKQPQHRPESAAALAQALAAIPVPAWSEAEARAFWQKVPETQAQVL